MRNKISMILAVLFVTAGLCACGASAAAAGNESGSGNGKLSIVTTIFPEYDWVKNIIGENPAGAEITLLLDNGVDLHSYQPTAADIVKISNCDIFIYVGGESDKWVDDALMEAVNKDMIVINLLDELGDAVKEEELVEGMQGEEEEEECEEEGEEEGPEYDEHVWLSLRNAQVLCSSIEKALEKADPFNAALYKSNCDAYNTGLDALDKEYAAAVAAADKDTLLFADRFPFRYMTDDYGLKYYAAFVGCSAESEASFETVVFLSEKVDELGLNNVCVIESSDGRIAETVIANTEAKNAGVLMMDSLQSEVPENTGYLEIMQKNLDVLKEALK
ncbi:MAG: zinc ABC transporter substrate-binding protein [Lachnospiraceae bacterium]|nr:zinc ABC transporter substrate-binding protein [Lachnospiraceae bacterium]